MRSGAIGMEVTATASGRTRKLPDGTRYEFNMPGRLLAISDVAGNRTTFEVDSLGLIFSMTEPAGKITSSRPAAAAAGRLAGVAISAAASAVGAGSVALSRKQT